MSTAAADIGGVKVGNHFYDRVDIQRNFVRPLANGDSEATLLLGGIRCGGCVNKLQQAVRPLPGVTRFDINYTTHRARLVWNAATTPLSSVFETVEDAGFDAQPFTPGARELALK
ncbi:MAG: heavy metal-associated domain-containing protein, partial [Gammaproteobacteria bacterium]